MGWTHKTTPQPHKQKSGNHEANLVVAVSFLQDLPLSEKVNYSTTAVKFDVKCTTLRNRYLGLHRSSATYHEQQKLLTSAREEVLLEWMFHHADEGRPWGCESIKVKLSQLIGKRPSNKWVRDFKKHHKDKLKFCGASGLDPK